MKVWKPKDDLPMAGDGPARPMTVIPAGDSVPRVVAVHPAGRLRSDLGLVKKHYPGHEPTSQLTSFPWPGLHRLVMRMPPVVAKPTPYDAMYPFDWLSAAGTSRA
jgi:hypothetical protein